MASKLFYFFLFPKIDSILVRIIQYTQYYYVLFNKVRTYTCGVQGIGCPFYVDMQIRVQPCVKHETKNYF